MVLEPVFAGSQEGGIAQLAAGKVDAAAVHSSIIRAFSRREGFRYRAIFTSEPYADLPVMAHPRVAKGSVEKVRAALLAMADDAQGRKILESANAAIGAAAPLAFVGANDSDYDAYRRFYTGARR